MTGRRTPALRTVTLAEPGQGAEGLLVALVRGEAPEGGWPAAADARWEPALGLCERHGIAPLLHQWLTVSAKRSAAAAETPLAGSPAPLPPQVRRRLRSSRLSELGREAKREAALLRALEALAGAPGERPIPALLYKGAASARTLYAAPELRPRGDLDLLVAPADARAARARLLGAGFQRHAALLGTPEDLPDWHELTLRNPQDPAQILDLHQGLLQPERQALAAEGLLGRSSAAPGLPGSARLPSPEDAALACALSLAAHELRSPLVAACDLALLLPRCDPGLLAARARSARVARALFLGLAWLLRLGGGSASLCGAPLDPAGLRRLSLALGLAAPVRAALARVAGRYDLRRLHLGRPEQLLRKALVIDRPLDVARFAAATLRRAIGAGPRLRNPAGSK